MRWKDLDVKIGVILVADSNIFWCDIKPISITALPQYRVDFDQGMKEVYHKIFVDERRMSDEIFLQWDWEPFVESIIDILNFFYL
jgi:hypothetical protein